MTKKGKQAFPTVCDHSLIIMSIWFIYYYILHSQDEQIRSYVKEILDKANLEEITMKTVCKQVYAKYPDFNLTDKKDFIKATVKAVSTRPTICSSIYKIL